jgi:prepilin-type N-terminal cleavage/methylation domain-containing protein
MKSKYKGFTLIEITLVIVLISILLAITTPLVSSVVVRNDLGSAHEALYNALLRAQQLSKNNYKNLQWRVCVENNSKTYIITAGTCNSTLYPETIKISSNIDISSTQTLDIAFKPISGELDYINDLIQLNLSGRGVSKYIRINKSGVIDKEATTDPISNITTNSIVTNGLVLHLDASNINSYPGFSTGQIWNDLSINNNNGTLINTPTYNTNGYFDFDHTQSERVTFSNASSLQFLNRSPYTLESWVYPTRNPGLGNYTGILDREDASMGYRNGYELHFSTNTSNQPYFSTNRFSLENGIFNQSGISVLIDSSSINNSWHHIVTTYDGTNLSLYRNGSSIGVPVVSTGNITNTSKALTLGVRGGQYFGGRISNTRIYNRALTAAEVQQNFNATKGRFGL